MVAIVASGWYTRELTDSHTFDTPKRDAKDWAENKYVVEWNFKVLQLETPRIGRLDHDTLIVPITTTVSMITRSSIPKMALAVGMSGNDSGMMYIYLSDNGLLHLSRQLLGCVVHWLFNLIHVATEKNCSVVLRCQLLTAARTPHPPNVLICITHVITYILSYDMYCTVIKH